VSLIYILLLLRYWQWTLDSWHKGSNVPCVKSPVVNEERMRLGHVV